MRIANSSITSMMAVLIAEINSGDNIIYFQDASGSTLCEMEFTNIVEDTSIPGEFFFEDPYGSRILRALTLAGTVTQFRINKSGGNAVLTGTVGLINTNQDIMLNSVDWEAGQVLIISSLKLIFPSES